MRSSSGLHFSPALIIVIVVIFDAAEKIDDFIELKAPLSKIAFSYYLNFIPFFINQFSGLFTFIAVIFFTSKMAYQTEIIAILSGGVSFNRFLWPYFLSAAAITLLSLVLNLVVIPIGQLESVSISRCSTQAVEEPEIRPAYLPPDRAGTFVYIRDYRAYQYGWLFRARDLRERCDRFVARRGQCEIRHGDGPLERAEEYRPAFRWRKGDFHEYAAARYGH